jgi:hypothetical protein
MVFHTHEMAFPPKSHAFFICHVAFSDCFFDLSLRCFLLTLDIHSSLALCSFIFEAHSSHADKRVYHNAHAVHHTTSVAQLNISFHHSSIFFHDSLALFKASCFFVI